MADQKLYPVLIGLVAAAGLVSGCAQEAEVAPIGVKMGALAACSGTAGESSLQDISRMQVLVQNQDGTPTQDVSFDFNKSGRQQVGDIPEGPNEMVTILGYNGGGRPAWFARKKHVVVQKGQDNPVSVVLSRFGGYSCPSGDNEYTHRMFPSATDLGGGKFLIAGGLTTVQPGGQTKIVTAESSRKAFIYDSATGVMSRISSLMQTGRGGHAAVLVRGAETNRVIIFGGTNALIHNPGAQNGFAWSYDAADAHSTVDVFEWDAGTDPAQGVFVDFGGAPPQMLRKRVFPLANVISTDGLVLVCGGGTWGVEPKPDGYQECDVFDASDRAFLADTLSNNFMAEYRAGASVAAFQQGEVTRLLFVGGTTSGAVAEVYTSSTAQRDGVGGSFITTDVPGPQRTFFQSLTRISANEFVMLGGVSWNGNAFDAPSPDNAWKLTVNDLGGGSFSITPEAIAGLGVGRYFHAAAAPAKNRLVVLGGFVGNDFTTTTDARHLAFEGNAIKGLVTPPDGDGVFAGRGGMGSVLLDNDTILIVGGISAPEDLATDAAGAIEVYTPSSIWP